MSILHITSGDFAGELISKTGIESDIFVWHDILYTGPRNPGWPTEDTISARADFLQFETGGGLKKDFLMKSLKSQYDKLKNAGSYNQIILWFDACLFDMSMLAHILTCLQFHGITSNVELLCIDSFPGVEPYDGLGQLTIEQLASAYVQRKTVTAEQFAYAIEIDKAFALCDKIALTKISNQSNAPLPCVPAATSRWLKEIPESGLGRLEQLALDAVKSGCVTPAEIYKHASTNDTHPQFWGDTTMWGKINSLADRQLINIEGPTTKLPVWECENIEDYRIRC
jgi:hypothetical protein